MRLLLGLGLGGVILFDYDCQQRDYQRNIQSPPQLQALCAEINSLPAKPLIFIDQEGGKVRRLKPERGFIAFPSAKEFGQLPWLQRIDLACSMFTELRALGIHYNLAPVLDFAHDSNPNIGALGRAYAANSMVIRENVGILHRAARLAGLGLCLKHYPGIGAATVDSHRQLMRVEINPVELEQFHRLGEHIHGNAILLSHALVQGDKAHEWGDKPVSLSVQAVQRLRAQCQSVLLITDDMQMQGVQLFCDTSTAIRDSLAAGVDMLIIGNNLGTGAAGDQGDKGEAEATAWAQTLNARAIQDSALHARLLASQRRITTHKSYLLA